MRKIIGWWLIIFMNEEDDWTKVDAVIERCIRRRDFSQ